MLGNNDLQKVKNTYILFQEDLELEFLRRSAVYITRQIRISCLFFVYFAVISHNVMSICYSNVFSSNKQLIQQIL